MMGKSEQTPGQLLGQWLATIFAAATLYIAIKNPDSQAPRWFQIAPAAGFAAMVFVVLGPPMFRRSRERLDRWRTKSALKRVWPHFLLRVDKLASLLDGTNTRSASALVSSVKVEEGDIKTRDTMTAAASQISLLNALAHDVRSFAADPPTTLEDARKIADHYETIFAGFYTTGINKKLSDLSSAASRDTWLNFWHDWNELRNDYLRWADAANTDLKDSGKVFGVTERLRQWH